jgi:hypothetical protein
LNNNPQHPQAYYLLAPLVAGAPADIDVRQRAFEWLDNNSQHPQAYHMLAPLVAGVPADIDVRQRALEWLNNNPQHPHAYHVLAVLVAGAPADADIRRRALEWLDNNPQHPEIAQLVTVLIARSPDDEAQEWIKKGIDYIHAPERKNRAAVLAATLVRSKARHDLIDYALEFAIGELKSARGFILNSLSRACAYSPSNALNYMSCSRDQNRRKQVSFAIAKGILQAKDRLPDLIQALDAYPPAIVFEVLAQCLRAKISTSEFLSYVARTLNRNFRQPGYGAFLRILHRYPETWEAIIPELYLVIKDDFAGC